MDIRRFFSNHLVAEAERQNQVAQLLLNESPLHASTFAHLAVAAPEVYRDLFRENLQQLKSWFIQPESSVDAIQSMGVLLPYFVPASFSEGVDGPLLEQVRQCLSDIPFRLIPDKKTVSEQLAGHLTKLDPEFAASSSGVEVEIRLEGLFKRGLLNWQNLTLRP